MSGPTTYYVGDGPYAVIIEDLDADGIVDVATANWTDSTVTILKGFGTGALGMSGIFDVGNQPYTLIAADINGDGHPDLVTPNESDDTVSVLYFVP